MSVMHPSPRPLIRAARIAGRVRQMGAAISRQLAGRQITAVVLLDGAMPFAADLLRTIHHPDLLVRSVRASSYHGTASSGSVTLSGMPAIVTSDVLLIDDILDTGRTLQAVERRLREEGVERVHTCVLLDKPSRRAVPIRADWVGFTIPDRFVVGYGLDHDGRYRHLPDVCTLGP
jgi:hypoxanthine phosphoribosyltransferase